VITRISMPTVFGHVHDYNLGGDVQESKPKCPTCQSANVQKVELPEDWVDRVRSGLRFR
jgi:hypothetical protein